MKKRELKFIGIDFWSRPRFIDQNGNHFGCLDKLFQFSAGFDDVMEMVSEDDIVYFGRTSDCDPMGTIIDPKKIKLVEEYSD